MPPKKGPAASPPVAVPPPSASASASVPPPPVPAPAPAPRVPPVVTLRPADPGPNRAQHEARLPDAVLQRVFGLLQPEQVARCMSVCQRWRQVAGDEVLWRSLCKSAFTRYHPEALRMRKRVKAMGKELLRGAAATAAARGAAGGASAPPPLPPRGGGLAAAAAASSSGAGGPLITIVRVPSAAAGPTSSLSSPRAPSARTPRRVGSGAGGIDELRPDDLARDHNHDDDDDEDEEGEGRGGGRGDGHESESSTDSLEGAEEDERLERLEAEAAAERAELAERAAARRRRRRARADGGGGGGGDAGSSDDGEEGNGAPPALLPLLLPDPSAEDLSLSLARQAYLAARRARRRAALDEVARLTRVHSEAVADFRGEVARLRSFRLAFRSIPLVRSNGIYALRHEYVRQGVRDMFHVAPGVLKCVYHRCFWFREDGSLLYAMLPGQPFEAIREFRRVATALDIHRGAGATRGVGLAVGGVGGEGGDGGEGAAALSPAPAPPKKASSSRSAVLNLNTQDMTSTVGKGFYRLEGRLLLCDVVTSKSILTRWVCEVGGGFSDRLTVLSVHLTEPGADPGTATPLLSLAGETIEFRAAPVFV
jgi:hypothetical protein